MLLLLACTAPPTFTDAQVSAASEAAGHVEGVRLMVHVAELVGAYPAQPDVDPFPPAGLPRHSYHRHQSDHWLHLVRGWRWRFQRPPPKRPLPIRVFSCV